MPREVEGLENLNRILELPLGSKFGMFVDGSMNAFKWDPSLLNTTNRDSPKRSSSA